MIQVPPPPEPAFLHGTEKQVAFATQVRSQLLDEIEDMRDGSAQRLRFGIVDERAARGLTLIVRAADTIARVHRADWWIAQRGRSAHSIVTECARQLMAAEAAT